MRDLSQILTFTVTPGAAASYYTNGVNLGGVNVGNGEIVEVIAQIAVVPTGAASTLNFHLACDAQSPMASGYTSLAQTGVIAFDDARFDTIGKIISFQVPREVISEAYIGLVLVIGTAEMTAGTFNCWLGDPAVPTNLRSDHLGITEVTGMAASI